MKPCKRLFLLLPMLLLACGALQTAEAGIAFYFNETDFNNAGGLGTTQQSESDFNESITNGNTLTSASGLTFFNSGGLYKPTANSVFSLTSNAFNAFNISPNATAASGLIGLWNGAALASGNITVTAGIAGGSSESAVYNSVAGGSFQFFGIIADSSTAGLADFDAVSFTTTTGAVVVGMSSFSSGQTGAGSSGTGDVPEPSTAIAMGLLGVLGFAGNRRRRRQS